MILVFKMRYISVRYRQVAQTGVAYRPAPCRLMAR
jgi:hypothetical protein